MFANYIKKQLISAGVNTKDANNFQTIGNLLVNKDLLTKVATILMMNGIIFSSEKQGDGYLIDTVIDLNNI